MRTLVGGPTACRYLVRAEEPSPRSSPSADPPETARRHPRLLRSTRHPNGPTEAINGRLEHLRGSYLGFRNLTNYIARCLLETGGFRPHYTLDREEPLKRPGSAADATMANGAFLRIGDRNETDVRVGAGPHLRAQPMSGSRPSWVSIPILSAVPQISAILPSATRKMPIPSQTARRPVGVGR